MRERGGGGESVDGVKRRTTKIERYEEGGNVLFLLFEAIESKASCRNRFFLLESSILTACQQGRIFSWYKYVFPEG